MRSIVVSVTVALALLVMAGPAASAPPHPRELSHGWQFRLDPHARGGLDRWRKGGPRGGWQSVSVPHVFDPRPLASLFHGTIGWYRLRLIGPRTPRGFGWALRFEGVRRSAAVWLNGRRIGIHQDPYAGFTLPARGLRRGHSNLLVVRVVNRKGVRPREGWWNWGGITRPVRLVPRGPLTLDELGLVPRFKCSGPAACSQPVVRLAGLLGTRARRGSRVLVDVRLRSPSGLVTRRRLTTHAPGPGGSKRISFRVPVRGAPELWSPDHPALYGATVVTRAGRVTSQVDRLQIGLRAVEVKGGLLYLNGRRVQLRGASIQEDLPGQGPALHRAGIAELVAELRALGANVTRAQYGLSQELMSALDRAGILLWSQAPVYHRDVELRHRAGRIAALASVRATVLEARNHPSVMANSVANEPISTPDARRGTRTFLRMASRLARSLDPATPVALDISARPGIPFQRSLSFFSLIGLNSYFGWYAGREEHSTASFDDLEPFIRAMRRGYPAQGLVVTEFGAEATFDGALDQRGSYEFQSDYLSRTLDVLDRNPFLGGAIYWTLREFAVKPHWDGGAGLAVDRRDALHHKGLISYAGQPKPAWAVARRRFTGTPLYGP